MTLLYTSTADRGQVWRAIFAAEAPDVAFVTPEELQDPAAVRYLAAWDPSRELFARLPNLEALFSVGAGVDQFDMSKLPPHVRLVRMIEPGLTEGMVEYACAATLMLHRDFLHYRNAQRAHAWDPIALVPAAKRRVGVMGLGQLGQAVLTALRPFGFSLSGWSRSRHSLDGIKCYAGADEMDAFFQQCDILICLLPLTDETSGILCRATLEKLPRGAGLINVARGKHVVESDLLALLDEGHLSGAVLDVTETEPLAQDSPLWDHPRIMLTPHMASMTRAETSARALIANIRRLQAGQAAVGEVSRDRGY